MMSPIEPTASPETTHEPRPISLLRRLLYSDRVKVTALQGFWRRLYYLSLFAMNYGGASGCIETSGEKWVLHHVVAPACADTAAPVIFDVGANIGLYAINAHIEIPNARIHAFEPSRETYEILRNRIDAAGAVSLITPHNIGFSNASGEADLFSYAIDGDELSILASMVQRLPTQEAKIDACRTDRVKVETIDHFCLANAIPAIDLLKIDVEGHELAVLQGANRILNSGNLRMIQFEFGPANIYSRTYFFDFWEMLSKLYRIYRIVPRGIVPMDTYREQHEVFLTSNFLAICKAPAIEAGD